MKKKIIFRIFIGLLALTALFFGTRAFIYSLHHEETDNAQVEGNISPIIPKVPGYITSLQIEDNQVVKKGDTLLTLDDRDLRNRLSLALAAYANAEKNLEVMRSDLHSAYAVTGISTANQHVSDAAIKSAEAKVWKADQDFRRYTNLLADSAATQQQFEVAKTDMEVAESQLSVLKKELISASRQTDASQIDAQTKSKQIAVAETILEQRKADVEFAQLQLSYAVVTAPEDGFVYKKSIQLGQYVNAGQPLFSVIQNTGLWVVANFKETQLEKMKVGDEVEIRVDAFKSEPLKGVVASFAKATGSRFSVLPPDNATGNFVKIVQRVSVKILITGETNILQRIGPGMSVEVAVVI